MLIANYFLYMYIYAFTCLLLSKDFSLKHSTVALYTQCIAEAEGTTAHLIALLISALLSKDF